MGILVIAEHDNAVLKTATLNAVTAAVKIGGEIHVLVAGANCGAVAEQAAKVAGVAKVRVADAAHYGDQTAENLAALIVANAGGYTHILAAATSNGKNTLPRVAALLDVAQSLGNHQRGRCRYLRPPDLRRQRAGHRQVVRRDQGHHGTHHRLRCRREFGRQCRRRSH